MFAEKITEEMPCFLLNNKANALLLLLNIKYLLLTEGEICSKKKVYDIGVRKTKKLK